MTKSLTSIWLKNMHRVSKVQQARSKKLFKSLLPKPARKAAAKKVTVPRSGPGKVSVAKTSPAAMDRKPSAVLPPSLGLAGIWRKGYCTLAATRMTPARRMLYWLYLPSGLAGAEPWPLVVMLHGCKQTAVELAAASRMNQLGEKKRFAVLYPQQSAASDSNRCWHWYKRATQQGQGDVLLIANLVRQVQSRHPVDSHRTYVAGLSAGGAMAAILALRHPELIAAAGLHSAPVFGTSDSVIGGFQAMQQGSGLGHREAAKAFSAAQPDFPGVPVMVIQGKNDAVVRPINADQLVAQFAIINKSLLAVSQPEQLAVGGSGTGRNLGSAYRTATYRGPRRQPVLVKCEIDGLGHAWSGGEAGQPYSAPEGPDASALLWDFFSRHQRLGSGVSVDVGISGRQAGNRRAASGQPALSTSEKRFESAGRSPQDAC